MERSEFIKTTLNAAKSATKQHNKTPDDLERVYTATLKLFSLLGEAGKEAVPLYDEWFDAEYGADARRVDSLEALPLAMEACKDAIEDGYKDKGIIGAAIAYANCQGMIDERMKGEMKKQAQIALSALMAELHPECKVFVVNMSESLPEES